MGPLGGAHLVYMALKRLLFKPSGGTAWKNNWTSKSVPISGIEQAAAMMEQLDTRISPSTKEKMDTKDETILF